MKFTPLVSRPLKLIQSASALPVIVTAVASTFVNIA